ncbi:MAG TPA: shikimate dehydrogenase [Vicinamibacteria bacterium]|nr:shikimate dehydrogenase [Vicinamibacteria bacterium]
MTQICVALVEETTAGMVARMGELAPLADLFEIRADRVTDLDLLTILRARTRPLVLTCRPASQGGACADDDPRRRMVLLEAVKRGYDYVDVELHSRFLDVMIEKVGEGLIVSHHDLEGMPADLDQLYKEMTEVGADVAKIVVTPRSIADVGRLLAFAARAAESGGPPLVALALGPLGTLTRVLAGRYGAPFTYASAAPGAESAPGQLTAALLADLYRVRSVSEATKVYGVLGRDVVRSLSPVLHNRALEARGLDAVYVPLQAEALPPFIEALPALGLSGFSVTRPYKVEILPYLHEVDEAAALCGSVNTVVVHDGLLQGSTSDGTGVLVPLKKRIDVKGRRVVILGAGGAARAAALALLRKGAQVTLLARDPRQAWEVASVLGCTSGALADAEIHPWDVLINATPVGSGLSWHDSPLSAERHRKGAVVLDMVYDPLETRFLREAQAAEGRVIGGLEMLVAQAAAQFEAWTGLEAPVDVMKATALYLAQARKS